jgi:hypothetical protein
VNCLLFETSQFLDPGIKFASKPFVFYYPQLVIYENKGLNPTYSMQVVENTPSTKRGGGPPTLRRTVLSSGLNSSDMDGLPSPEALG